MNIDNWNLASDIAIEYPSIQIDAILNTVLKSVFALIAVTGIYLLVISIIWIIANWKLFKKAGEKGWKSIIPIYNIIILFKVAGVSPLFIFGYLAFIIPIIGWIAVLGLTIYLMYNLAKVFGKNSEFAVGLVLLNPIFMLILAFGKSEYKLDKTQEAETIE